jgi:hypothetical protein
MKHTKPNPEICPETFCFNWVEKGDKTAIGPYADLNIALNNSETALEKYCSLTKWNPPVTCIRLNRSRGIRDFYEPIEPFLEREGYPWFYFISDSDKISDDTEKLKYIEFFEE